MSCFLWGRCVDSYKGVLVLLFLLLMMTHGPAVSTPRQIRLLKRKKINFASAQMPQAAFTLVAFFNKVMKYIAI